MPRRREKVRQRDGDRQTERLIYRDREKDWERHRETER